MRSEDEKCRSRKQRQGCVHIEVPSGVLLIAVPARTTPVLKVAFGAQLIMPPSWPRRSGKSFLTASLRASATLPRLAPRRCATRTAHDFRADHFATRVIITCAASNSAARTAGSPARLIVRTERQLLRPRARYQPFVHRIGPGSVTHLLVKYRKLFPHGRTRQQPNLRNSPRMLFSRSRTRRSKASCAASLVRCSLVSVVESAPHKNFMAGMRRFLHIDKDVHP